VKKCVDPHRKNGDVWRFWRLRMKPKGTEKAMEIRICRKGVSRGVL
jgi:hypothetical protein